MMSVTYPLSTHNICNQSFAVVSIEAEAKTLWNSSTFTTLSIFLGIISLHLLCIGGERREK